MSKSNRAGAGPHPGQDEIARRAYELYLQRGSVPGHETDDWLQAEAELAAQAAGDSEGERPREAPTRRASSESGGSRRDTGSRRSLRQ